MRTKLPVKARTRRPRNGTKLYHAIKELKAAQTNVRKAQIAYLRS
jgi:hypothetical protein